MLFPLPDLTWQHCGDFRIQRFKIRLFGHFWKKNKVYQFSVTRTSTGTQPCKGQGDNRSYVSFTSKPDHPRGFARSHCPEERVFAQLSLPGGQSFELGKFSTVWKKNAGTSRFVLKKPNAACKAGALALLHINFCKYSKGLLHLCYKDRPFSAFW